MITECPSLRHLILRDDRDSTSQHDIHIYLYLYYKPWLLGVYIKYKTYSEKVYWE